MIILASKSPRRKELLSYIEPEFEVLVSNFDESSIQEKIPEKLVRKLAFEKANCLAKDHPNDTIIGSDTVVVSPYGEVFGMPKDESDAIRMLSTLSGKTHKVITGVCVIKGAKKSIFHKTTKITFSKLSDSDISEYIKTGESFDKAGAYGIQGYAGAFVERINGDYFSVVGLPINTLRKILKKYK